MITHSPVELDQYNSPVTPLLLGGEKEFKIKRIYEENYKIYGLSPLIPSGPKILLAFYFPLSKSKYI